jgi:hypothetical protein
MYERILWSQTLSYVVNRLKTDIYENVDDPQQADLKKVIEYSDAVPQVEEALNDMIKQVEVKSEGKGFGKIQLRGRGLMGAGVTCKNLRSIQGSGTASDLKYKQLGSKFIRVADLKKNKLKLVYANRTSVGPLRDIDPKLAQLINTLLFEKDIDQQLYGQLSLEDKKLFCEILKATHLQHQFSNAPTDPLESLKAEFDKLRGQVMLGNDNPDLLRELKTMAVDLYSNKLISEADFKAILLNL